MILHSRTATEQGASVHAHIRSTQRRLGVLGLLAALLIVVGCADAWIGGAPMPAEAFFHALISPATSEKIDTQIVWDVRLPMTATAITCGAALAMSGAQMQTTLGNPLAEPYTLGIASAASFGASLAVVTGFGSTALGSVLGVAGSAWVFAIIGYGIILGIAKLRGPSAESMILVGIAIVFFFDALLALMQYMASVVELEQVVFWTLGSLTRATWPQIALMGVMLTIGGFFFVSKAWTLTAFRMGDDRARSMGIPVERTRSQALLVASLLAATAVSMAGTIGFIGLIGPHIARTLVGEDQRFFLPASTMTGALLLTSASMVAKIIQPGVILPVGIITAVVGVPVFLTLILSRRRKVWS